MIGRQEMSMLFTAEPQVWSDAEVESAARGLGTADGIERRLQLRALLRDAFEERARAWAVTLPGSLVEFPRDEAPAIALGVPCEDCRVLVRAQGEDGHRVSFVVRPGVHWAAGVTAWCGSWS